MQLFVQARVIMQNMVIKVRKDDYVYDVFGVLRGIQEYYIIPTSWRDHDDANTGRATAVRSVVPIP